MTMPSVEQYLTAGFAVFSNGWTPNPGQLGYQPFRVFKPDDGTSRPLYIRVPDGTAGSTCGRVMDFYSAQYFARVGGLTEVATMISDDAGFDGVRTIIDFRSSQQTGWRPVTFSASPFSRGSDAAQTTQAPPTRGVIADPPAECLPFLRDPRFQVRQFASGGFGLYRRTWAYDERMTLEHRQQTHDVLYRLEPVLADGALPADMPAQYNTHMFVGFVQGGGALTLINAASAGNIRGG